MPWGEYTVTDIAFQIPFNICPVQHLIDERAFRIQRAVQCSVQKTVLPKDQWPTYDEDREKGRLVAREGVNN